ncbi:hypothetical protein H7F15_12100 [Pontibacter sp. Tf4]|uniref:hypothetical protein n=1 Tax=Pontibacter sp. Tf4 TaxID=2761620 RepID=UPI001629E6DB|nr:hypothetical protein [Pontibacter sp. Tf4]MBB6611784.1 hypothetical protein [Pontibacter sp. Tf4]
MKVMITFDGYNNPGKVTLLDEGNEINSSYFPEDFDAKWQDFQFMDDNSLQVNGYHKHNTAIGSYTVTINPE